MKVHLIAPALPPKLDGIGDHSAGLAAGLAAAGGVDVTVLAPAGEAHDPIPGVRIVDPYDPARRRSTWRLYDQVAADRPDWVVLQYNPFSYGRWGLNLSLPRVMQAIVRRLPPVRFGLFAHEQYVPLFESFRNLAYGSWQRWQFYQLARTADVILSSTGTWADGNRARFPGTPVVHMPVGSNLPRVAIDRDDARGRLGLEDGEAVLGVFGRTHNSRLMSPVTNAVAAARAAGHRPVLLYLGPDVEAFRAAAAGTRVVADGRLPADEVSRRLSAVDVYLSTFDDGVSTRRGSFLAAIQHGLACAATVGRNTDPVFRATAGTAFLPADPADPHGLDRPVVELLGDADRRRAVGAAASDLFEREFAWPRLIDRLLIALNGGTPPPVGG